VTRTGCRCTNVSCASGTRSCQQEVATITFKASRAIELSACLHRSHLLSCSCISSGYLREDFCSRRRRLAVAHLMNARWLAIQCCQKATGHATCRFTCACVASSQRSYSLQSVFCPLCHSCSETNSAKTHFGVAAPCRSHDVV